MEKRTLGELHGNEKRRLRKQNRNESSWQLLWSWIEFLSPLVADQYLSPTYSCRLQRDIVDRKLQWWQDPLSHQEWASAALVDKPDPEEIRVSRSGPKGPHSVIPLESGGNRALITELSLRTTEALGLLSLHQENVVVSIVDCRARVALQWLSSPAWVLAPHL